MDGMPTTPAHAKPVSRRNHLWVLFAIALPAAVEVWASWVGVGSRSGFPVIRLPFGLLTFSTGFSLAVGMEAYWGYALFVWLAAAPGPRSRKFAMASAVGAFALSLLGQIAYHLMLAEHVTATPVLVVIFVAALPVTLLGLVAFLIHLMHADRRTAEESEREAVLAAERIAAEAVAADERTALRAELEAAREALAPLEAERDEAWRQAAEIAAKAEILERKLAAQKANGRRAKTANAPANAGRRKTANASANGAANAPAQTQIPDDVDARTEALGIYLANPEISGKDLGEAVGLGARWGQLRRAEFAAATPSRQGPEE